MSADLHLFGARFQLTRRLVHTSSFEVFAAEDHGVGRPVCVVSPAHADVASYQEFSRFCWMALGVTHPAVVGTHRFGVHRARPYVALPQPDRDLAGVVAHGPLPADRVGRLGSTLSSALAAMHAAGIRLGALHPGHVGLDPRGAPWLSPWPLAEAPPGWGGETAWLPPEATADTGPTEEGDIWSLSAVLLSALVGRGPGPLSGAATDRLAGRLRGAVDAVDPALLTVIARGMATDPARRFASAREMHAALSSHSA